MEKEKYNGIIPALYACYDDEGEVSEVRTRHLTKSLVAKGIKGLYVGGSSGECIYQSVEDRKKTLKWVMEEVDGKITIIAHVACNNTKDSMTLAAYAESLGVDAIAAIPPIYFKLPEHAIANYWNAISSAAPTTDFIIYNIPQLAGTALTPSLYKEMLKNPNVIGVKNSSMPTLDIQLFKMERGEGSVVFNGPDEQLVSGLAAGADGGIGGTYGVMPEVYLRIQQLVEEGNLKAAIMLQEEVNRIIFKMCSCTGNLYAVMKEILRRREGIVCGSVRLPLSPINETDEPIIDECIEMIDTTIEKYTRS